MTMASDQVVMSFERFKARYKAYKEEPQQDEGLKLLYDAIKRADQFILTESQPWAETFSKPKLALPNPLKVPYFSQRDNYTDPDGTCYSSSCAMALATVKPGSIKTDDDYLKIVLKYGLSIDALSQIQALAHFGVKAKFTQGASKLTIINQIKKGIPVPCGYLHHGTPSKPTGGGHWCTAIGYTDTGVIVHDPWGTCDLLTGTFPSRNGASKIYSDRNWTSTRWMANGISTGWAILIDPPI